MIKFLGHRLEKKTKKIKTKHYDFKFFILYKQLNLNSLIPEKRKKIVIIILLKTKVIKIFIYGKNNNGYQNEAKLHQQVVNKTLPIIEAIYPRYLLHFLFNNTKSHSVYTKNIF